MRKAGMKIFIGTLLIATSILAIAWIIPRTIIAIYKTEHPKCYTCGMNTENPKEHSLRDRKYCNEDWYLMNLFASSRFGDGNKEAKKEWMYNFTSEPYGNKE